MKWGTISPTKPRSPAKLTAAPASRAANTRKSMRYRESVTVLDTDVAMLSIDFRVGGFSAVSYMRLLPAAGLIALALAVLFTLCNELDVEQRVTPRPAPALTPMMPGEASLLASTFCSTAPDTAVHPVQRAGRGDAGGRDGPGSGPAGGAVPHAFSGIGCPAGGGCGELS